MDGKENFRLFSAAIENIGGVPAVLKASDINDSVPEESTVMLMVGYLCIRLIELGKDMRAALTIQKAWRHVLHLKYLAAVAGSIAVIERVWKGFMGRKVARQRLHAIVKVQALIRTKLAMRHFAHTR